MCYGASGLELRLTDTASGAQLPQLTLKGMPKDAQRYDLHGNLQTSDGFCMDDDRL